MSLLATSWLTSLFIDLIYQICFVAATPAEHTIFSFETQTPQAIISSVCQKEKQSQLTYLALFSTPVRGCSSTVFNTGDVYH